MVASSTPAVSAMRTACGSRKVRSMALPTTDGDPPTTRRSRIRNCVRPRRILQRGRGANPAEAAATPRTERLKHFRRVGSPERRVTITRPRLSVGLSRRGLILGSGAAAFARSSKLGAAPLPVGAAAESPPWVHGLALLGTLKYPPGFAHFDYVNPAAPKGGLIREAVVGTYDNFNMAVAGVKGDLVEALSLIYDTLMAPSLDEVASEYGLVAEASRYPSDFSWVSFRLRPAARWHDGRPISVQDVIFSLETFKKLNPQLAAYYRHVVHAETLGEHEIKFQFDATGIRELPQVIGELTILPRHWWEGNDRSGKPRNVSETTLEPPLGSGAYRIGSFDAGRSIAYERVADYWAKDLPVNVGVANLATLRYDYFRDPDVAFEAFQAHALDWRVENAAKNWATGYGFPAVAQKRVVLEEFPIRNLGIMQAFAFNTRRPKFQDPRVRRAFNFAFDFESINQELFYGQYTRISSYFDGTELASSGLPQGRELELLEGLRAQVPQEVFSKSYWNPVSGNNEALRANLLTATQLLFDAGFKVKDFVLIDPKSGEQMSVEILITNASFERVILFYQPALERLGIDVSVRLADDVQYVNRLRDWDFDIVVALWEETLTPGNEQWDYWGSQAAALAGSRNLVGVRNPAVDALIERIVFANNREDLVAATKALDRVLLWNHYVVPQWNFSKVRTARWDVLARPQRMPKYGLAAFPAVWWWDAARAASMAEGG
jgi:microcin C transport system substrate-binding protein